MALFPDYQQRVTVLETLGYVSIDLDHTVQLKGRVDRATDHHLGSVEPEGIGGGKAQGKAAVVGGYRRPRGTSRCCPLPRLGEPTSDRRTVPQRVWGATGSRGSVSEGRAHSGTLDILKKRRKEEQEERKNKKRRKKEEKEKPSSSRKLK